MKTKRKKRWRKKIKEDRVGVNTCSYHTVKKTRREEKKNVMRTKKKTNRRRKGRRKEKTEEDRVGGDSRRAVIKEPTHHASPAPCSPYGVTYSRYPSQGGR